MKVNAVENTFIRGIRVSASGQYVAVLLKDRPFEIWDIRACALIRTMKPFTTVTSLEWAPKFAAAGTTVIDNSSAWRMDPTKKLVVPEINADVLTREDKIIANPNCSTIQMVMTLAPLHKKYNIKRIIVSTYQSLN